MERVSIFKPCDIEYPQYDKPVRNTEDFLKGIASSTIGCNLVDEHYGKPIGSISNITFTDGELCVDVDSSESLSKFSPSFEDLTLIEKDDCFLATNGYLIEVASTFKPRLDNSEGGSQMGEDNKTEKLLTEQVEKLNKEIAKKDLVIERNKEKLDKYESMEQELTKLREENEKQKQQIEEQKPIVENFTKFQEERHEELLEKVAQGNDERREKYKHFSNEDLELILDNTVKEQPAKGAGSQNAPGLDKGGDKEDDAPSADKAVDYYTKTFGEAPSFIKD